MHSIASPGVKQEHTMEALAAFASMPTPQAIEPFLQQASLEANDATSRPLVDEDTEMRNASPGDGRVAVKPTYEPETEIQPFNPSASAAHLAPEPAPQSAPIAPMTNTTADVPPPQQPPQNSESSVVTEPATTETPNGAESHSEAPQTTPNPPKTPSHESAAEELSGPEKDTTTGSPKSTSGRKNSHSSDSSASLHLSPKDPDPSLHLYETGEYLFAAGDGP